MRKKTRIAALALGLTLLTAAPALAASADITEAGGAYRVAYTGKPGEQCVMLILRAEKTPETMEAGDILYIDQAPADETTGEVVFEHIRLRKNVDFDVFLSGAEGAVGAWEVAKTTLSGAALFAGTSFPEVAVTDDEGMPAEGTATPGGDGTFTLALPDGWGYTLTLSKPGHLSCTTTVSKGETELGELKLLAGDVNGDGKIDGTDLSALLAEYGQERERFAADLNESGGVNVEDLSLLLQNYGMGEGGQA